MKDKGQINRGSVLGDKIYELAKQDGVDYIFEIGTWNGLGSTKCIIEGINDSNTPKKGMSIECNLSRFNEARYNLGILPNNFVLRHGTIVNSCQLPTTQMLSNTEHKKWLKEDLKEIKEAPNVFSEIPPIIDLCILDGGEFSGYLEFLKLYKRSRYIVLDDTTTFKHNKTREHVLQLSGMFEILMDETKDRNGFLICKNKKYV